MEANKILQADFLDILFDEKNKEYGAYQLRKSYNKRLVTALITTSSILLLFFVGNVLANSMGKTDMVQLPVTDTIVLTPVQLLKPVEPIPPPPPLKVMAPPQVKIADFTPPVIVEDVKMNDTQKPPEVELLETVKIGLANQPEGADDDGLKAPPTTAKLQAGTGLAVAPPKEKEEGIFISVQNPARFPGGIEAWKRYLERNLVYPDAAQERGTQATVFVSLVVDKNGKVSEVQALNNPGDGLAEEAVRIIKKGPDWVPAEQNGNKVAYRFQQGITFMLSN